MALESSDSFTVYNGTGFAAVGYPITFSYTDPDHIQVSVQAADVTEATILSASQFDVSADPAAVYTTAAYPSTTKVTVARVVPYTQPTVWPEGGRFLAQTHEAAADRAVMQIQQVARDVAQSIRLPYGSGVPTVLAPTAGGLMGFDDEGAYTHYDAARVRELAQLEGGVDTNPMATFADATARGARVPDFTGQLGLQRDDGSVWYSTDTVAGAWASANSDTGTRRLVRTEGQFSTALAAGGVMEIVGTVNLTASYAPSVPVVILGDKNSKITFSASYLLNPSASMLIQGVQFEGTDRLSQRCIAIGGDRFTGRVVLKDCSFKTIGCAFCADGAETSNIMPDIIIDDCRFEQIGGNGYTGGSIGNQGAIVIDWNLGLVVINNCKFKDIYGNPILVGHNGMKTVPVDGVDNSVKVPNEEAVGRVYITNNWIRDYDRNGIETFQADYSVIAFNNVHGGTGSWVGGGSGIGISAAGNHNIVFGNIVKEYWGYGLEISRNYGQVENNIVDTCTHDRLNLLVGLSVGGTIPCNHTIVRNNHFINIVNKVYSQAAIQLGNSTNILIEGNRFTKVSCCIDVSASSNESVTFKDNEHYFDAGSNGVGLAYWTFAATSGTKHVVIGNITRNAGAVSAASFYKFAASKGGYYDWTSGAQVAPGPGFLEFGASSDNLVIA